MRSPSADVHQVIQQQRAATMRSLRELTRLKGDGGTSNALAWTLTLDGLLFQGEAEVRWLDLCEARLTGAARAPRVAPSPQEPAVSKPAPVGGRGRVGQGGQP